MKIKKYLIPLCLGVMVTSCSSSGTPSIDVPKHVDWCFSSPNGELKIDAQLDYGKLSFSVSKDNVMILNKSDLSMSTNANDFIALTYYDKKESKNHVLNYDNKSGKASHVETIYNEATLTFKENNFLMDVTFRIFDDGYGFQYGIRAVDGSSGTLSWEDEGTSFALPEKCYTYTQKYVDNHDPGSDEVYYSYEGDFNQIRYDRLGDQTYVFPLLYEAGDHLYSMITESGLIGSGYHGSMLTMVKDKLKIKHSNACGNNPGKTISYPFSSPWRVASVGTLEEVVESNIYESILGDVEYWKPDNYEELTPEEKATFTYDWVEAGSGNWNFLYYGAARAKDLELQSRTADMCARMGWKWLILDAGWDTPLDVNAFRAFTAHCHEIGVKVMVWANVFVTFQNKAVTGLTLDNWKYYGIDGIKIDFWDGLYTDDVSAKSKCESKETIEHYDMFYQEAAKRQMTVDCHGANKPTAERRKYPNVFNREAIQGAEFKSTLSAANDVYLSLTRCVIGPSDYTPATQPLGNNFTLCHNLAQAICFESGCPTYSGLIDEYIDPVTNDYTVAGTFLKDMPALWDETKLVSYSLETLDGLHVIYARRKGNKWYVGGMVDEAKKLSFTLPFLEEGEYSATTYADKTTTIKEATKSSIDITRNTSIEFECVKSGGFTMIIEKK